MNAHPQTITIDPTTFGSLHLPAMSDDVRQAVAEHLSAVLNDESKFDEDGNALNKDEAERSLEEEFARFQEFCEVPCLTQSDVQAKIAYVLTGTQGQRTPLSEYLYAFDGNDLQVTFLRSMVLGGLK